MQWAQWSCPHKAHRHSSCSFPLIPPGLIPCVYLGVFNFNFNCHILCHINHVHKFAKAARDAIFRATSGPRDSLTVWSLNKRSYSYLPLHALVSSCCLPGCLHLAELLWFISSLCLWITMARQVSSASASYHLCPGVNILAVGVWDSAARRMNSRPRALCPRSQVNFYLPPFAEWHSCPRRACVCFILMAKAGQNGLSVAAVQACSMT